MDHGGFGQGGSLTGNIQALSKTYVECPGHNGRGEFRSTSTLKKCKYAYALPGHW